MNLFKRTLCLILSTGLISVALCSCDVFKAESGKFIAEDYGLVANDVNAAEKNSSVLSNMIKKSSRNKSTEILFSAGTYYFNTSGGSIKCKGVENLTFVGNNTLFVNSSYDNSVKDDYFSTCLIETSNSKNIRFKNISFDYLDYTSLNGTVTAADCTGITVKIDSGFLKDGSHSAISGGELVYAVSEISSDKKQYCSDHYLPTPAALSLDKDSETVTCRFSNNIAVGSTVVFRFGVGGKIASFVVSKTDGFYMENVNVYSSPCAVVYSTDSSSNFEFEKFNISPRENSKMLFSANVDGVHLKNFSGTVALKNCNFKGMGDDAFNTNSRAALVTLADGKSISVKSGYEAESMPDKWAKKGDLLNVYNSNWECLGQLTVAGYSFGKIKLSDSTDIDLKGCYLENTRYLPKILIENTTVDLSRARGFMLRSKNITVKGCTVKNTALPAIIASPDINKWYEMSPSENVSITDCVFDSCATANYSQGGIVTFKYTDDDLKTFTPKIHKNVTVANNTFINNRIYAVYAAGVDGLKIENNSIENQTQTIKTVNCENIDSDIQ